MSVAGVIPAAGSGQRLGAGPKAFLRLGDRTLLEYAVDLLAPFADEIVIAVPAGREEAARALVGASVERAGRSASLTIVPGGAQRQETIERLLDVASARWLVIHDAARPLTPPDVVKRVLEATRASGAATAGLPVADTLHDVDRDRPVPRDALRAVQTPQGFARELLMEAHRRARAEGRTATDDADLVRALGRPVTWVEGSPWSHKLTRPSDRSWLEALQRARVAAQAGTLTPT